MVLTINRISPSDDMKWHLAIFQQLNLIHTINCLKMEYFNVHLKVIQKKKRFQEVHQITSYFLTFAQILVLPIISILYGIIWLEGFLQCFLPYHK